MALKDSFSAKSKLIEWLLSGDTGTSSLTLAALAYGKKIDRMDIPSDVSDFGRCYRLVKAVPEVKGCFHFIAKEFPKYEPILENWDRLCFLYDVKNFELLYKVLKELWPECMRKAGFVEVSKGCWKAAQ